MSRHLLCLCRCLLCTFTWFEHIMSCCMFVLVTQFHSFWQQLCCAQIVWAVVPSVLACPSTMRGMVLTELLLICWGRHPYCCHTAASIRRSSIIFPSMHTPVFALRSAGLLGALSSAGLQPFFSNCCGVSGSSNPYCSGCCSSTKSLRLEALGWEPFFVIVVVCQDSSNPHCSGCCCTTK